MKVTIHIEIGDYKQFRYKKEVLSWLNEHYQHLVTFDFDSYSEATVVNYATDLLKQGEEIVVIINHLPEGNSKPLLKFLDTLIRQKDKQILVVYNGQDALLDKMLKVIPGDKIVRNIDTAMQKERIKTFFRLSE